MSLIHDYTVQKMSEQRIQAFHAEAAQDRLAALARGQRPSAWRSWVSAVTGRWTGRARPATLRSATLRSATGGRR